MNRSSISGSLKDILEKAEFRKKPNNNNDDDEPPNFDCSGGLSLSGSESESDDDGVKKPKSTKTVLKAFSQDSQDDDDDSAKNNLQKMREIAEKLAGTSAIPSAYKSSQKENMNVADLLAMGEEGKAKASKKRARASQKAEDSDSDNWEDVEGKKVKIPRYVKLLKKFEYVE